MGVKARNGSRSKIPHQELTLRVNIRLLPRQIFAAVGTVLVTIVLAPIMMIRSMFPRSAYATYRLGRMWNWLVAKLMGITFTITGTEKIVPGASYIITPNHQSFADILALFVSLPTPFRWVIKKELLKIPLFGKALGATGAICLDRCGQGAISEESPGRLQQIRRRLVSTHLS